MRFITYGFAPDIVGSRVGTGGDGWGILFGCSILCTECVLHRAAGRLAGNGHERLCGAGVDQRVRGNGSSSRIHLVHGQRRGGLRACRVGIRRGGAHLDGKRAALRDGQLARLRVIGSLACAVSHGVSRRARTLRDGEHTLHGNGDPISGPVCFLVSRGDRHRG